MNILLICMLPVCIIATGFLVLKSVQLGWKWCMQSKEGKEPELKTPIADIKESIDKKKADEVQQYRKDQLNEWMFGK